MRPCHGRDRGFESRRLRQFYFPCSGSKHMQMWRNWQTRTAQDRVG
jgi:hypothetical protein